MVHEIMKSVGRVLFQKKGENLLKKKICFFVMIAVMLFLWMPGTVAAESLVIDTGKSAYWRYELVDITASLNTRSAQALGTLPGTLQASIWRGKKKIVTVGNMPTVALVHNGTGHWQGKWPIPFNPRLGTYTVKLQQLLTDGNTLTAVGTFKVKGRKPYQLPAGFSVVTYEGGKYGPNRTPGLQAEDASSWRNLIVWTDYMGADAFWHCVGQTQIWGRRKAEQYPWSEYTVRLMHRAAAAAHDAGLQYGAWITAFVVIGNKPEETGYRFTLGYNREQNALRQLRYVSLGCEKRTNHIIELLEKFEADPNVDYLGLDYMRTDFGGYEFAGNFVEDMSIAVPGEWERWSDSEKSLWMARLIEIKRDPTARAKWRWWRAHKVGLVIEHIVAQVKPTKPLWVFSLGWQTGHQHGQDLLMMLDAGVGFNAPMFYSIDRPDFPHMLTSWKNYLSRADASVVVGEPVDWNLLQRTLAPAGPREHLDRQTAALQKLKSVSKSFGFFWHDLARAFFGARGPYGNREWIMAGAASFTQLKAAAGRMPLSVRLQVPQDMVLDRKTKIQAEIVNSSTNTVTAIRVELVPMPRLTNLNPEPEIIESLAAGETRTVTLYCKTNSIYEKNGGKQMVAVRVTSLESGQHNPWFDFVYLPVSKTLGPPLPQGNTPVAVSQTDSKNRLVKKEKPGTIPTPKVKGAAK